VLAPGRHPAAEPWVRIVGRPVRVPYGGSVAPIAPSPGPPLGYGRRLRRLPAGRGPRARAPTRRAVAMFATLGSPAPVVATFHSGADRSRCSISLRRRCAGSPAGSRCGSRCRSEPPPSPEPGSAATSGSSPTGRTWLASRTRGPPTSAPVARSCSSAGLHERKGSLWRSRRSVGSRPSAPTSPRGGRGGEQRSALGSLDAGRPGAGADARLGAERAAPPYHAAADVLLAPSSAARASGSSSWRPWPRGSRSWRAGSPATTRWCPTASRLPRAPEGRRGRRGCRRRACSTTRARAGDGWPRTGPGAPVRLGHGGGRARGDLREIAEAS